VTKVGRYRASFQAARYCSMNGAAVGAHRRGHRRLHRGDPLALVVQVVAQRAQDQAFASAVEPGLDPRAALGHGPGIADGARRIGRTDQKDEFVRTRQGVAGNGGVVVVEGREAPDDHTMCRPP
jgi:hypothetical protein